MQVKNLTQDTIWAPGSSYGQDQVPAVSVLLPTFRRGKSSLFRRCVESILAQTLNNIELIIIDDASTDGTADQINEFQRRDGRVSYLRHQQNIGLPAISEYEGYIRARGSRIAFAFDDTIFNPDALERLLSEALLTPWAVIYGHIEWPYYDQVEERVITTRLGAAISQGALRTTNFIPNSAVLMPREIIDDVGLYDPHILVARVCDWDLWRRVASRYELRFVDVPVGVEEGMISSDSLGNTYSLDTWAAEEWKRTERNERLRPANFPSYEVLLPDDTHGLSTRMVCDRVWKTHAKQRSWSTAALEVLPQEQGGYTLVVTVGHDASVSLCFDFLPQALAKRIRVVVFSMGALEDLARATCVIFVRAIEPYRVWIDAAVTLGIPIYYLLDDNLPLLAQHGEYSALGEDLSLTGLKQNLLAFEGVMLTSPKLVSYFEEHALHRNLIYYPVGCNDQRPIFVDHRFPKEPDEITIAFAGGAHRLSSLWGVVVPALALLAREVPKLHLVFRETYEPKHIEMLASLPSNIRVTMLSFEPDYVFALRRFARYAPDIALHAPSETCNNPYKTFHPLLTARLIDAVPVMPITAPYHDILQTGCAAFVANPFDIESWLEVLRELVSSQQLQLNIKKRNAEFCATVFSCEQHTRIFDLIYQKHGGEPSWLEQSARLYKLCGFLLRFGIKTGVKDANAANAIVAENLARESELAIAINAEREAASRDFFESKLFQLASEIAKLRNRVRYSRLGRATPKDEDLFLQLTPAFDRLKLFSERIGWKKERSSLELSESLTGIPYREYSIDKLSISIRAISVAFSADWICTGVIGLEVVDSGGKLCEQVCRDLDQLSISEPVLFELAKLIPIDSGPIRIRVFARSETPIYIFEFANRRMAGLLADKHTPFMELISDN